jgi:formylmethanofuran dehydrogenase subunit C
MKGGVIEVYGNAGDLIGAPYRGETKGMRGGTIIIHGNAGNEIGCWMMGGLIKVKGNCGLFPGIHMKNGTILIHGNTEGRCGALMKGGKVIILGKIPTILSSFTFEEVRSSVKANGEKIDGPFYVFTGDLNEEGSGKIFISTLNNTHLKFYEKYIE